MALAMLRRRSGWSACTRSTSPLGLAAWCTPARSGGRPRGSVSDVAGRGVRPGRGELRRARGASRALRRAGRLRGGRPLDGGEALKALRARHRRRVRIMASPSPRPRPARDRSARPRRDVYQLLRRPARRSRPDPAGQSFARDFGAFDQPTRSCSRRPGGRGRAPGHRALRRHARSVLEEIWARVKDGILGDFRFDRSGDITPAESRSSASRRDAAGHRRLPIFEGAIVDRVVTVPARLAR